MTQENEPTANPALLSLLGKTPMARVRAGAAGYWAKLESLGVAGMKSRAAVAMLAGARERGELLPGGRIIESTSGTLGIGLAFAGRALGHPVTLVSDAGLEPDLRRLLTAYGVGLEIVLTPHAEGGWQRARLDRLREMLKQTPGAYWPDQYDNPDNPGGYEPMAREIMAQVGHIDVLVASVGSGGHCCGLSRVLRSRFPDLEVIGVDSIGSRIFGQPDRPRLMRGLGSSILPRNVPYPLLDEVHWIGPTEAVSSCRSLAANNFVTGGWSTGAVALVAGWKAQQRPGCRVVTVFPDGPQRYLSTIFDDAWCERRRLTGEPERQPRQLARPDELEVAGWGRCSVVRDPRARLEAPV